MLDRKLFPIRESKIETYLVNKLKSIGGGTIKLKQGEGLPDRIVLYRGWAGFVETKRPGKDFEKLQRNRKAELERLGFNVSLCDTKEKVDEYIDNLKIYNV